MDRWGLRGLSPSPCNQKAQNSAVALLKSANSGGLVPASVWRWLLLHSRFWETPGSPVCTILIILPTFSPLFIRAEFSTRGQCAALTYPRCGTTAWYQGSRREAHGKVGGRAGGHLTLRASSIPVVSGCVRVGTPVTARPHVSCPVWELRALLTDHQAAVLGAGSPRPQKPSRNQPATALKGDISAKAPAKPLG